MKLQPFRLAILFGLGGWLLFVTCYGLFWLVLAVLVNLREHSAAKNVVTLAGAWLLIVLVIPSLLSSVAALLYPMPARAELIIADRDAEPNLARDGARALANFRQTHPELQPTAPTIEINDSRRQVLAIFLENNRAFETVAQRYDDQLAKQQRLLDRLSLLSPAIVMHEALNHLAGTGGARFQSFRAQMWQWVIAQRAFFVPKIMRGEKLTLPDYDALPRFHGQAESWGNRLRNLVLRWFGLAVLTLALLGWSYRRLRSFAVAG
jgi:ABC-2 type transport system permease protein